jgi:hypothetical protein
MIDRYLERKEQQERDESASVGEAGQPGAVAPGVHSGAAGGTSVESSGGASDERANEEEEAYQRRKVHVQEIREQLTALHAAAARLANRVPFPDLLRYYRRDPWYRMAVYLPKLRLRDFHQSFLRIRVLSQLDESFAEVRSGVVRRMTEELFGGAPPPFENFRPAVLSAPDKLGLPRFRHVKSANILYNFLRHVYHGRMQESVRILTRTLPVRQRDSSSDMVLRVAGVEETLADLEDFDRSFAPDSDDGKAFFRVRYGVEKDITLHRTYRNIVQQRDREVRGLIDRGMEHVRGLQNVFTNLQRTLTDQIRERYANADQQANPVDGLDTLLDTYVEKISTLDRLMKQTLAMEEGY